MFVESLELESFSTIWLRAPKAGKFASPQETCEETVSGLQMGWNIGLGRRLTKNGGRRQSRCLGVWDFYLLTRVLPSGLRLSVLTHQDGDGVAFWASRDPVDRQSGFAVEVGERT